MDHEGESRLARVVFLLHLTQVKCPKKPVLVPHKGLGVAKGMDGAQQSRHLRSVTDQAQLR